MHAGKPFSEGNLLRMDYKSFWRGSDEIERIAGHKRQEIGVRVREHLHIRRIDDFGRAHAVQIGTVEGRHGDFVVPADVAQRPEKSVAMSCDGDISLLPGQGRAGNMPYRSPQSPCIDAFLNHCIETDSWNLNFSKSSRRDWMKR